MSGKKALAPCGHTGVHIIGQYVQCLSCDGGSGGDPGDEDLLVERCRFCGSSNLDFEFEVDVLYPAFHPGATIPDTRCFDCGRCW